MSIRRCPACRNLVERDSVECPICGRSYTRAMIGRIFRWLLLLALVGLVIYWIFDKR